MKINDNNLYSVVIPVYNSEKVVAETVSRLRAFFIDKGHKYEVILVNDGSSDNSWSVISELARKHDEVKAVNLLHNYGQHNANMCGFRLSQGDYVITMDDDLQNPPEEIQKLIDTVLNGYDLVLGKFKEKKHSFTRRVGSKIINYVNRKIFKGHKDLVLSNFRIISREVVDRVCAYRSRAPYIPGLVMLFSCNRVNVVVEHLPRAEGKSNYTLYKIMKMVSVILFNYSSIPLRLMAGIGFVVSAVSLGLALYYFLTALAEGTSVPGWATLVIMLSFFNGILILLVSVVGEYVVRLLRESGSAESYYIKDMIE